jgi:hypothetical protein
VLTPTSLAAQAARTVTANEPLLPSDQRKRVDTPI